ncbi:MAG: NTP transferase domain-containing protein, partial [Oscillospiraceae bacterium]|nr:NTP transferase domain-containing protein [Oscillospiraceae bacterium]
MSHGGDIRGKTADISMVILAAGLSRRMGVFKPLLPVGDLPAILRCVRTAEEAGVRAAVVVTGHKNEELESVVRAGAKSAQLVHNSMYRDEMFSSVRVGVSALPSDTDGFFLLPADCCAFAHGTMISLIRRFADDGGKSVVRPINHGRRGHPPLIPVRFIDPLLSFSGQNGLKGFLSPLPTVEVETNDAGTLLDMDTPDDYAALLEHLGLPCYPNRAQCAELMEKYHVPPNIVKHGEQVASVAIDFAHQMQARGALLDIALLESACLLHDIRKGAREDRGHAREGMDVLLREGY